MTQIKNRDIWHGLVAEMYAKSSLERRGFQLLMKNVPLDVIFDEMKSDDLAQLLVEKHHDIRHKATQRRQDKSNRSIEEEVWHQLVEAMYNDYDYETSLFEQLKTVPLKKIIECLIREEMNQCLDKLLAKDQEDESTKRK